MAGVDLEVFRFDYDLTFAVLLMNADGTIYHTYGGRDWTGPQSHLSLPALESLLRDTLVDHRDYEAAPRPPRRRAPRTIEQIPPMAERIEAGKAPVCFHCHMVNDMEGEDARRRGRWRKGDAWIWPDPVEIGLSLDPDVQTRVTAVAEGSPAAVAGMAPGDRLLQLEARRVLTFSDVQRVLDEAKAGATTLAVRWLRDDREHGGRLRLAAGWKEPDPLVYSWRPSKWPLVPNPGFGGPTLRPEDKRAAGLDPSAFAMRVNYVISWGERAHLGRNATQAGLRKGDLLLSAGGKSDFASGDHFQAWFRLTQRVGTTVPLEVWRNGKRRTIDLPVVE